MTAPSAVLRLNAHTDPAGTADVFDEHAAARVPVEGPVQDEEVLNDLVEDALTPGPEMDEEVISPKRFLFAGRRKGSSVKGKKLVKPEDASRLVLPVR